MPAVEKISIALTTAQLAALRAAVDGGEYATKSEIVREAIRDWQMKREIQRRQIEHLGQLWDEGIASGAGKALNMAALREEARSRLAAVTASANRPDRPLRSDRTRQPESGRAIL